MAKRKTEPRPALIGSSGGSLFEMLAPEPAPPAHPLVGLFCLQLYDDNEFGVQRWRYQAMVHSVVGDVVMLQYFDALVGYPSTIEPISLANLLDGSWKFFTDQDHWREYAQDLSATYWRLVRAKDDRMERNR